MIMNKYFIGITDKDALSYKSGETIRFDITFYDGEKICTADKFIWHIETDDGNIYKGESDGSTGSLTLETRCNVPGFVHVIVKACNKAGTQIENSDIFEGGAGADIDKITAGCDIPDDFDDFWRMALSEINAVKPELQEEPRILTGGADCFRLYDVKIRCAGKMPATALVSIPEGAFKGKKYPLEMKFRGYSVASADLYQPIDRICISLNPHGLENLREDKYYQNAGLDGFGFNNEENENPDTCYFKYMILRNIQGKRWGETLPYYDGSPVYITGGSMGAFQSVSCAALSGNIAYIKILIPWLCDLGGINKGRLRGWRPDFRDGLRYYDIALMASRIDAPCEIESGLGDYVCPPSGQVVLYHNLKGPKKITFIQNRTHPYYPPKVIKYTQSDNWNW